MDARSDFKSGTVFWYFRERVGQEAVVGSHKGSDVRNELSYTKVRPVYR